MISTFASGNRSRSLAAVCGMLMSSICGILACASFTIGTNGDMVGYGFAWVFGWFSLACLAGTLFVNAAGYVLIAGIVATITSVGGYLIWEYALGWIWSAPWIDADTCPAGMVYNGHHDVYDDGSGCVFFVAIGLALWKSVETAVLALAVLFGDLIAAAFSYELMFRPTPEK